MYRVKDIYNIYVTKQSSTVQPVFSPTIRPTYGSISPVTRALTCDSNTTRVDIDTRGNYICCPDSSKTYVNLGDGNGLCCPNDGSYTSVNDRISGSMKCCKTSNVITDASGNKICCPNADYSNLNGECCPKSNFITGANGVSRCCPSADYTISKEQGGNDVCCHKQRSIKDESGKDVCCPETFIKRDSGGKSICCSDATSVNLGDVCCPSNDYVSINVNGKKTCCLKKNYSKTPDGRETCCEGGSVAVDGLCCPNTNYSNVNGSCCPLERTKKDVNGSNNVQCCNQQDMVNIDGKCCGADRAKKDVNGNKWICCNGPDYVNIDGKCCPTKNEIKVNGKSVCCAPERQYGQGTDLKCCPSGGLIRTIAGRKGCEINGVMNY